jgi:hypothetical protein
MPIDPFSGRPLIYRPDGEGYQLYSIGPDGKDDGGQFVSWSRAAHGPRRGDLTLDGFQ